MLLLGVITMRKDYMQRFMKTGKIDDYLAYKKNSKGGMEVSKEFESGEKNEVKRGNNNKEH